VNPGTSDHLVVECACGKRLKAPASAIGRKAKCPKCGNIMVVEAPPPPPDEGDLDFNAIYDIAEKEAQLAAQQEASAPTSMRCPSCGGALAAGAVLCVGCGFDIRTKRKFTPKAAAAAPTAPAKGQAKSAGGWFSKATKKDSSEDEEAPAASGNVFLGIGLGLLGAALGAIPLFFGWYKADNIPFIGWLVLLVGAGAGFGVNFGYKAGTHFAGAIAAAITIAVVLTTKFAAIAAVVAPTAIKVVNDVQEEAAVTRDTRVLQMLVEEEGKKQNVKVSSLSDEDEDGDGSGAGDADFDKGLQVRRDARKRLRDMPEAEYKGYIARADEKEQIATLTPHVTDQILKEKGITTGWFGDDQHRIARAEAKKRVEAMSPEARKEAIEIAKEQASAEEKREMEAYKKEMEELKAQEEKDKQQEKLASKSDSQKNRDKGEESSSGGSIVGFAIFMVLAFAIWAMIPTFIAMALAWKIAANA
jgi:hypothetical protein